MGNFNGFLIIDMVNMSNYQKEKSKKMARHFRRETKEMEIPNLSFYSRLDRDGNLSITMSYNDCVRVSWSEDSRKSFYEKLKKFKYYASLMTDKRSKDGLFISSQNIMKPFLTPMQELEV